MKEYVKMANDKGYAVISEITEDGTFTAMRLEPRENGTDVYRKFLYRTCKCGKTDIVQVYSKARLPKTCRKCNAYNVGRKNYIKDASEKTIYRRKHR